MSSAIFSEDGRFRYCLYRGLNHGKHVCFVMLNPSVGDHARNDPTITRCVGFMESWGFDRLSIVNLYAYIATDPEDLIASHYAPGPDNHIYWVNETSAADLVVCAWGERAQSHQVEMFKRMVLSPLYCLEINKSGNPKHPLYVKSDTIVKPWRL